MPSAETTAQAVREQLGRVLASPGFARNERLSRFLRFVVEGHLQGKPGELTITSVGWVTCSVSDRESGRPV